MSILSDNMRYLRSQKGLTQQKVADALIITRARYSKYEEGIEPPLVILQRIAHYFQVSIDLLLSVDLRKVPMQDLLKLEGNRILLPITVDRNGENFIEVIPHKSKAGYLNGYADAEYIESLQHISLPFLAAGKYRAFPVEGDSMPPHNDGSIIIGRYVESIKSLKPGRTYIFLTRNEGITYKRLDKVENDKLYVSADNPFYEPYTIDLVDSLETWEYACSLATTEFSPGDFEINGHTIKEMFVTLRSDIKSLYSTIKS